MQNANQLSGKELVEPAAAGGWNDLEGLAMWHEVYEVKLSLSFCEYIIQFEITHYQSFQNWNLGVVMGQADEIQSLATGKQDWSRGCPRAPGHTFMSTIEYKISGGEASLLTEW